MNLQCSHKRGMFRNCRQILPKLIHICIPMKAFLNDEFRNKYSRSITKRPALLRLRGAASHPQFQWATATSSACITSVMPEDAARELSASFRQGSKTAPRPTVIEPLIAKVARVRHFTSAVSAPFARRRRLAAPRFYFLLRERERERGIVSRELQFALAPYCPRKLT